MKKLNRREFFASIAAALLPAWFLKKKAEFRVPLIIENKKAFQSALDAFTEQRRSADVIANQHGHILDAFLTGIYARGVQLSLAFAVSAVFAVFNAPLEAQPPQGLLPPHACFQPFHFTGAAQIQQMPDNLQTLCNNFTITYSAQGFGAISLLVQDAPDAGNTPGTWVTYAGTINSGSNPNTSITGGNASTNFTGFFRWVRVNLTSVTGSGSVDGVIYGDQVAPSPGSSGAGGTACPNPCPVIGPTAVGSPSANPPVQISEQDGNGNLIIPTLPTLSATVSLTASGLTQIVALSAAKSIRIGHLSAAFASGVDFQLEYGTGVNCAAGTTALTGVYKNILTYAYDDPPGSPLVVPAGNALCANLGTSVTGGGLIQYGLF